MVQVCTTCSCPASSLPGECLPHTLPRLPSKPLRTMRLSRRYSRTRAGPSRSSLCHRGAGCSGPSSVIRISCTQCLHQERRLWAPLILHESRQIVCSEASHALQRHALHRLAEALGAGTKSINPVHLLLGMCRCECLPHTERLSAGHLACSSGTPAAGPGKTCLRHCSRIRASSLQHSIKNTDIRAIPSHTGMPTSKMVFTDKVYGCPTLTALQIA